jgi:hypothetical protein
MSVPLQQPYTTADEYHSLAFVIQQLLSRVATLTLVKVVACTNNGGLAPYGFVDVIPLVNQVNGRGDTFPHGTLFRLPYFRLQGGTNAVILDPQRDDIGMAAFCSRDISSVKATPPQQLGMLTRGKAEPRRAAPAVSIWRDGLYIGGFLNGTPSQYVQFNSSGVTIVSPSLVTVQAPTIELHGAVHVTGAVTGDSSAVFQGNVTGQGTSLHTHSHPASKQAAATRGPLTHEIVTS